MMKVDVSEIKTFRACKRQWQLSSRNQFHLRSKAPAPALAMGTLFHESLAQLYLGVSLDKVMDMVKREMHTDSEAALLAMIPGYANKVLPDDLDRYRVLDIEHHFEIDPKTSTGDLLFPRQYAVDKQTGERCTDELGNPIVEPSLRVCGSIDMIVLDVAQNKIFGFEHKTCKNFRDETYLWMDEQPRVYVWALKEYTKEYNEKQHAKWVKECEELHAQFAHPEMNDCSDYPPEPEPATLGGIYLNEVRKLLRQFQHKRTLCTYSDEDLDNFMQAFFGSCNSCKHMVDDNSYAAPQPGWMTCGMCAFKSICTTYMYENLNKDVIVDEFQEEFEVRTEDHLEEKTERSTET